MMMMLIQVVVIGYAGDLTRYALARFPMSQLLFIVSTTTWGGGKEEQRRVSKKPQSFTLRLYERSGGRGHGRRVHKIRPRKAAHQLRDPDPACPMHNLYCRRRIAAITPS